MTTQTTTMTVDSRASTYWPDEANLAHFAEQAEEADRMEQAAAPVEANGEYAALYFGS